jgi:hypothetical protein
MAYSKAPREDTYSQHTLPAWYSYNPDQGSDIFISNNSFPTGVQNGVPRSYKPSPEMDDLLSVQTRAPLNGAVIDDGNTDSMVSRGMYVWEKTSTATYYFAIVGVRVYSSTDGITWAHVNTLLTSATTPVNFTEFINSATNTKALVLVDGVEGYVYTTNAAGTKITDVDFPSPHLPYPVFLDGYLFLAKKDTGDIYNSNLNSATAWTAGDFVSSEMYPDDIKAIAKIDNYLLAIGSQGSEYFYDAANATGSPLRRVDGASLPFGTFYPNSIAVNKNILTMLANMNDGEPCLIHIESMKWKEITPSFLIQTLNENIKTESLVIADVWGYYARHNGDLHYYMNYSANSGTFMTFGYSFKHDTWFMNTIVNGGGQDNFPVTRTSFGGSAALTYVLGYINSKPFFAEWGYNTDVNGSDVITNAGFGTAGADNGVITLTINTPMLTFGTMNLKTMSRFCVNAQQMNTSTPPVATIYWDDFDGTGSADTTLTLQSTSQSMLPCVFRLGAFRKRKMSVSFAGGMMIVNGFECSINKGMN